MRISDPLSVTNQTYWLPMYWEPDARCWYRNYSIYNGTIDNHSSNRFATLLQKNMINTCQNTKIDNIHMHVEIRNKCLAPVINKMNNVCFMLTFPTKIICRGDPAVVIDCPFLGCGRQLTTCPLDVCPCKYIYSELFVFPFPIDAILIHCNINYTKIKICPHHHPFPPLFIFKLSYFSFSFY